MPDLAETSDAEEDESGVRDVIVVGLVIYTARAAARAQLGATQRLQPTV